MPMDDGELLGAFVRDGDAETFRVLMQRQMGFVYAAALRQSWNKAAAEDITQAVLLLLWQRAGSIKPGIPIKAWLFKATRYVAANARRAEARRVNREREAAAMRMETIVPGAAPEISPVLDDALGHLSERDRRAVLLRFFEDQPLAAVGVSLGISEEAAKKRVSRAVEKLRRFMSGRGVDVAPAVLPGMLASHAAVPCPAHLIQSAMQLAMSGTPGAGASGSAVSLAKGEGHLMVRNQVRLLALKVLAATVCVSAATAAVVTVQTHSNAAAPAMAPSAPVVVAAAPPPEAAGTTDVQAEDPEFEACRGVLLSIVDAYEHDDAVELQSLYYADPGTAQQTMDDAMIASAGDLAAYRVVKTSIAHFGTSAAGLNTRDSSTASMALDVLARIGLDELQDQGDEAVITPTSSSPGHWPNAPLYFREVGTDWKVDIGRTIRVVHRVVLRRPVTVESEEQAFVQSERDQIAGYNAIADDIDRGKITDVIGVETRLNQMFEDLSGKYSAMECSVLPR